MRPHPLWKPCSVGNKSEPLMSDSSSLDEAEAGPSIAHAEACPKHFLNSQSPEKASLVLSRLKSALFPIQASPGSHIQLTTLNPRVHQSRPARPLPSNLVFLAPTVACSSGTLLSSWSAVLLDAFQTQSTGKPESALPSRKPKRGQSQPRPFSTQVSHSPA